MLIKLTLCLFFLFSGLLKGLERAHGSCPQCPAESWHTTGPKNSSVSDPETRNAGRDSRGWQGCLAEPGVGGQLLKASQQRRESSTWRSLRPQQEQWIWAGRKWIQGKDSQRWRTWLGPMIGKTHGISTGQQTFWKSQWVTGRSILPPQLILALQSLALWRITELIFCPQGFDSIVLRKMGTGVVVYLSVEGRPQTKYAS